LRNRQPERFGSLEIDHQLELGGLFNREIGRLGAFKDLVYLSRGAFHEDVKIRPVA